MWYKNIAGRFFGLVTKHACDRQMDGQTDRITTPKTVLAQLRRAAKTISSTRGLQMLNTDVDGGCNQHYRRPSEVYDTHRRTKLTAPETISRSWDMVVSAKI